MWVGGLGSKNESLNKSQAEWHNSDWIAQADQGQASDFIFILI